MKTKLLKKVRKRFEIRDYPQGNILYPGATGSSPHFVLIDHDRSTLHWKYLYYDDNTKERQLELIKKVLRMKIREQYPQKGSKKTFPYTKIWHNE